MARPTNADIIIRVSKMVELLTVGLSRGEILQYVTKLTTWGISTRTIDSYIAKATKQIRSAAHFDREKEIGQAITRLELLHQRNMSITDYKAAAAVQKQRSELLGLNEPTRKQISAELDTTITVEIIPPEGDE